MTPAKATILFEFRGRHFVYDGGLPEAVEEAVADLYDERGFWRGGYPAELAGQMADAEDELPAARWEIEHIGGRVVEIRGARPNGAIHLEDWQAPRIH